jgi:hypothetical protein
LKRNKAVSLAGSGRGSATGAGRRSIQWQSPSVSVRPKVFIPTCSQQNRALNLLDPCSSSAKKTRAIEKPETTGRSRSKTDWAKNATNYKNKGNEVRKPWQAADIVFSKLKSIERTSGRAVRAKLAPAQVQVDIANSIFYSGRFFFLFPLSVCLLCCSSFGCREISQIVPFLFVRLFRPCVLNGHLHDSRRPSARLH